MEWKIDKAKFASGEMLFLGAWNVGGIHYDGCRTKGDPKKYAATCKLPGIKSSLGNFETTDEAKKKVETAVIHWLSKLPKSMI